MQAKGPVPERPHSYRDDLVYVLGTIDGKEHLITRENYEELKPLILKPEMYGAYVANENSESEVVVFMKHIVSIRKERREVEG